MKKKLYIFLTVAILSILPLLELFNSKDVKDNILDSKNDTTKIYTDDLNESSKSIGAIDVNLESIDAIDVNLESIDVMDRNSRLIGDMDENPESIDDMDEISESINVDIPDVSGAVSNLPWANDEKFIKAKEENNTNILLAAYCAVLRDPMPGEEFNVHLAARYITGTVLAPGQIFSQNKTIGPYNKSKGYRSGPTYFGSKVSTTVGGGVCKISSTLYNVSILSNLKIIERYNHSMPVPYVPYGQDATVAYGVKDFKFKNSTEFPILIWAEGIENRLYIALYGKEEPPKVEWNHKILNKVQARKSYKTNPNLKEGEEKVIVEGMDGATVESWVTITYSDGVKKTKHLGISYYRPMPYIIEKNR